jgi:hypothetical protein
MSTDETYNGWKNYPTWAVNLWLSNDEELYNQTVEMAEAYANLDRPKIELADSMKTWVRDELTPDLGASFVSDLLGWAFDHVDWLEIASHWYDDAVNERV